MSPALTSPGPLKSTLKVFVSFLSCFLINYSATKNVSSKKIAMIHLLLSVLRTYPTKLDASVGRSVLGAF